MKSIFTNKSLLIILGYFLVPNTALASLLQYTYSSGPLEWQSTWIGGSSSYVEELIHEDDGEISFQFSFLLDEAKISPSGTTKLFIKNASLFTDSALDLDVVEPDFITSNNGNIIVNPDGSLHSWDLIFKTRLIDLNKKDIENHLTDHKIYITSKGGKNTCNCIHFNERMNYLLERYDWWIIPSHADSIYISDSSFENWKIERFSVPEPNGLILAIIGLIGFSAIRRRVNPATIK